MASIPRSVHQNQKETGAQNVVDETEETRPCELSLSLSASVGVSLLVVSLCSHYRHGETMPSEYSSLADTAPPPSGGKIKNLETQKQSTDQSQHNSCFTLI